MGIGAACLLDSGRYLIRQRKAVCKRDAELEWFALGAADTLLLG